MAGDDSLWKIVLDPDSDGNSEATIIGESLTPLGRVIFALLGALAIFLVLDFGMNGGEATAQIIQTQL